MELIKVAITDDHPMIITGLQTMLSSYKNIILTGMYTTGKELLEGLTKSLPDVLLLDIHLPDKTGDKLVPLILKKHPTVRIVALTNLESSFYVYSMVKKGVSGYLLKKSEGGMIIEAIEAVYKGEEYIADNLRGKIASFARKVKYRQTMKPALTQKEKAVLKLTMEGCTLQEISNKLFLGQRTVEYYRSNLLLKLEVKNMAELIKKAVETGLID